MPDVHDLVDGEQEEGTGGEAARAALETHLSYLNNNQSLDLFRRNQMQN